MAAQTVMVTGAASGIGKACVERLLKDGREVVAFDRNRASLGATFGGLVAAVPSATAAPSGRAAPAACHQPTARAVRVAGSGATARVVEAGSSFASEPSLARRFGRPESGYWRLDA